MSKQPVSEQLARIHKARMNVILGSPFFGTLLMRLPMVRDDTQPTFCTNGKIIKYNEKFCASLDDLKLRGILVHEVLHPALGHLWRIDGRNLEKWNDATDYAINNSMLEYAEECNALNVPVPWELPDGVNINPAFNGMSSEQIYRQLPDPPPGNGGGGRNPSPGAFEAPPKEPGESGGEGEGEGQGQGEGQGDGEGQGQGQSQIKGDGTSMEDEWKVAVTQAATVAKMRGNCPASIRKLVDELVTPKVPWQEQLREFVNACAKDDYTFARPARRYLGQGVILPGLHNERIGEVVVGVDTSGSIYGDPNLLKQFFGEVQGILDSAKPSKLTVIYCDASVQHVSEYEPGDTVNIREARGGGGTRFEPVFDYVDEHLEEPPVCLIYLTDTYGSFPDQEPSYPVKWACYGGDTVPWGEVLKVE